MEASCRQPHLDNKLPFVHRRGQFFITNYNHVKWDEYRTIRERAVMRARQVLMGTCRLARQITQEMVRREVLNVDLKETKRYRTLYSTFKSTMLEVDELLEGMEMRR